MDLLQSKYQTIHDQYVNALFDLTTKCGENCCDVMSSNVFEIVCCLIYWLKRVYRLIKNGFEDTMKMNL